MNGVWLGHVGSESQGEISEIGERAFVQDMLKYFFFFFTSIRMSLWNRYLGYSTCKRTHLQNVPLKFCSCREFILDFRRVRRSAKSDYSLHHVCPSVCPLCTWKNSAPTGQIFMKYYIWGFLQILSRKHVPFKSDKNNGCLTWRKVYL